LLYVAHEIGVKLFWADEFVRKFAESYVLVITLAGLVVITKHTYIIDHKHQGILVDPLTGFGTCQSRNWMNMFSVNDKRSLAIS
jgi:hypothetical protein